MEEIVEKIRARVAAVDPDGPRKVVGVFQINIQNDDGSTRNLTIDLKKLEVHEESTESPDVTLDVDEDTFVQLAKRELPFSVALCSGKATLAGDTALAACLEEVLKNKQ